MPDTVWYQLWNFAGYSSLAYAVRFQLRLWSRCASWPGWNAPPPASCTMVDCSYITKYGSPEHRAYGFRQRCSPFPLMSNARLSCCRRRKSSASRYLTWQSYWEWEWLHSHDFCDSLLPSWEGQAMIAGTVSTIGRLQLTYGSISLRYCFRVGCRIRYVKRITSTLPWGICRRAWLTFHSLYVFWDFFANNDTHTWNSVITRVVFLFTPS